jgi:hypothetical protein
MPRAMFARADDCDLHGECDPSRTGRRLRSVELDFSIVRPRGARRVPRRASARPRAARRRSDSAEAPRSRVRRAATTPSRARRSPAPGGRPPRPVPGLCGHLDPPAASLVQTAVRSQTATRRRSAPRSLDGPRAHEHVHLPAADQRDGSRAHRHRLPVEQMLAPTRADPDQLVVVVPVRLADAAGCAADIEPAQPQDLRRIRRVRQPVERDDPAAPLPDPNPRAGRRPVRRPRPQRSPPAPHATWRSSSASARNRRSSRRSTACHTLKECYTVRCGPVGAVELRLHPRRVMPTHPAGRDRGGTTTRKGGRMRHAIEHDGLVEGAAPR